MNYFKFEMKFTSGRVDMSQETAEMLQGNTESIITAK